MDRNEAIETGRVLHRKRKQFRCLSAPIYGENAGGNASARRGAPAWTWAGVSLLGVDAERGHLVAQRVAMHAESARRARQAAVVLAQRGEHELALELARRLPERDALVDELADEATEM